MFDYIKRFQFYKAATNSAEVIHEPVSAGTFHSDDELTKTEISTGLESNVNEIRKILENNSDLVIRNISINGTAAAVAYIDDLTDSQQVDNDIIRRLIINTCKSADILIEKLEQGSLITRGEIKACGDMKAFMDELLTGSACLLISGYKTAYAISVKGNENRSISEPQIEPVIRGPRDAFVESLKVNMGLIRTRIPSPNLSFETIEVGTRTHTKVSISYIRGVCPSSRISEVRSRLKRITIDGIIESGYLEEFIQDDPFSIFPQVRNTERPDVVSAALLEGRVAIITDNTPIVLIAPGEFFSLLQSAEDYYNRYIFSTFIRVIRFIALLLAAFLPAVYIAVTNYHQEMVPTDLLVGIASARTGVPFPTAIEALIMYFAFEVLYEAGIHLPKSLGQTISIVGALIIGQAAVQAKIVSPLMVIIISLTGITTFCIPQYNVVLPIRIIRFVFIILASALGLFGIMIGILYLLLHMASLRSFGVAYLVPLSPLDIQSTKDMIIRSPWWALVKRPSYISSNATRMKTGQKPHPPKS